MEQPQQTFPFKHFVLSILRGQAFFTSRTKVRATLLLIPLLLMAFCLKAQNFTMRPVKCGMEMPWEITYGPDNFIWATEARGYKVNRINPTTGASAVLLDLTNNKNFANYPSVSPQGGLMGLALHPNLLTGKPYIYLAYVFRYDGGTAPTGHFFKTKLVRYTYNSASQTLANEEVICDTIPGSNDHNGGRMTIGQINGQSFLFYSVGDMGAGQFDNKNRVNRAQNPAFYEGKIMRFNLEPDADANANATDKWIPNNNPFNGSRQNAVWSVGHRNGQGLVFANGKLYEAEHGPYSDDEINIIESGANYGHPLVSGLNDGNYNGIAVAEGSGVPIITSEQNNASTIGTSCRNPIKSFFPAPLSTNTTAYNNIKNNTPPFPNYYLSWQTIAPSGVDYYSSTAIPNWQNSILVTSLKRRRIYRLQLDAAGTAIASDTLPFFADMGRFRDLAISSDGTKIYVSCDSEGQTSGPTAGTTIDPPNKGCILEFTYAPNSSSICASTGTAPWSLWVTNVKLNTLNNTSDKFKDYATLGYSDYTNLTTTVNKGQSYPLSISPPTGWNGYFPNVFCRVWIDFNDNKTFEDNEMVLTGTNKTLFTQNITIPTTAVTGNVRMRVSMKWGGYPTACETFAQGEVEDYTVTIQGGGCTPCYDFTNSVLKDTTIYVTDAATGATFLWGFPQISDNCCFSTVLYAPFVSTNPTIPVSFVPNNPAASAYFPIGTTVVTHQGYDGTFKSFTVNVVRQNIYLPDLALSNLTIPTPSVQQGQILNWKVDIKNIGTAAITGNFSVKAYISKDNVLSADDVQNGIIPTGNFAAGLSVPQVAGSSTIPTTVAAGNYYLILVADTDNQVSEFNEMNNTIVSTSTFAVTATQQSSYCASTGTAPWSLWITNVKLNTLNNTSDKFKDYATLGYSDYTNLTTSINKGQIYPLSISPPTGWNGYFPNVFCRAWIDFNGNNTFEDNEKVLEGTNKNLFTQNILVPTTAITGNVRMRVSMKWGGYPTACEVFAKGEVEDYTVNMGGVIVNNSCRFQDSLELIRLYNATNGANWTYKWVLSSEMSTWSGVTLDLNGCVQKVILNGNNLVGTIPNLNLPKLFTLDLQNNQLSGTIPNFNLPNLQYLDLYQNQFSGAIPNFNLPNLQYLQLGDNLLSGTIANFNLPNLQHLSLVFNQLSGTIPNFNLPNLKNMTLNNNQLSGTIPNFNLPNLLGLGLNNNLLSGTISNFNLPNLESLVLNNNQLSGTIPNFNLPNLKYLELSNNQLSGTIPNFNLPNLAYLYMHNNNLSGCLSSALISYCGININISNNPNLATQNFAAFCSNNTGACTVNPPSSDIALSITATPSVYRQWAINTIRVTAKNTGATTMSNIKIKLPRPDKTSNSGANPPSVGTFADYCSGSIECSEWTIPRLAVGASATLDAPFFVLNATAPIVVTTSLLSAIPTDGNAANNTATISLNAAPPPMRSIQTQPTQQIPIVVDKISPSPTDGEVTVELESLDTREVRFDFSDTFGKTVKTESRKVEKGTNQVLFEVFDLPQGVYFVSPSTGVGKNAPTKFVKM